MSAEFLSSLIKACDPYIRKYGGSEGYHRFREDDARNTAQNQTPEDMAKIHMDSIAANAPNAAFSARLLLSMYAHGEKYGRTPQILKDWVLERLDRIGDGESAEDVLHLKTPRGVSRTKPMHNQLQCACFITLKMREGMGKSNAVLAGQERYGVTERHAYTLLAGIEISDDISNETLEFFRDFDISSDYSDY